MQESKDYWCRWISTAPLDTFEYHGPWWISGHSDVGPVLCAAVVTGSPEEAERLFMNSYDKVQDGLHNFSCEEMKTSDPFSSRFPRRDWMIWPITPKEALERRGS